MSAEQFDTLMAFLEFNMGFEAAWKGFGLGFLAGSGAWVWYVIRNAANDSSS